MSLKFVIDAEVMKRRTGIAAIEQMVIGSHHQLQRIAELAVTPFQRALEQKFAFERMVENLTRTIASPIIEAQERVQRILNSAGGVVAIVERLEQHRNYVEGLARMAVGFADIHYHRDDTEIEPSIGIIEVPLIEPAQTGVIIAAPEISSELIRRLDSHPEEMRFLPPREFEKLIAELLNRQGYSVRLTPATRDGGYDIHASIRLTVGEIIALVECKRYGASRKVSIDVVQRLYGILDDEGATTGIVATTSAFSKPAQDFQKRHSHRLTLVDFQELKTWIRGNGSRRLLTN